MHEEKLSKNWNLEKMISVFKYFSVCFFQRLNIISSKLVNTNINLEQAYYILEFQENVSSRTSRAQRSI